MSFRNGQGVEGIWHGDTKSWPGQNSNLFPIVGALKNDTVFVDGKPFHISRHGFARRSEFSLSERGEDYAVQELRQSPETAECYPFELRDNHINYTHERQ